MSKPSGAPRSRHNQARRTRKQTSFRPGVGQRHRVEVEQQIRLFRYIERVSKLTGKHEAWKILEDLVTEKRLDWLNPKRIVPGSDPDPVETAFDLFYRQYLRARAEELEIIERKPDSITVRCRNPCPTLEACRMLGMDTRFVCKAVYERPTQAFLSGIDPALRFIRNYDRIRPHAEFCEETIRVVREPGRSEHNPSTRSKDTLRGG